MWVKIHMIQKLFLFTVIGFLFSFEANASKGKKTTSAKLPQTTIESRNIMNNNLFGELILSGGLTSGLDYNGGFGMQGMLDYRFKNHFSVGFQGNIYFLESSLTSRRQLAIDLRANYHFIKEKSYDENNWDWYIGIDLGEDIRGRDKKITAFDGYVGIHTGLRYKLNYKWMVFAEIGSKNTSIGLALSL